MKSIKENMGAGFSYTGSSIFPTSRGGGMNKGGFGGANNLGGPNMMYTYEIKPLTRNLQPKPNSVSVEQKIHVGNYIEGKELNKRDDIIHRGSVLRVDKTPRGDIKFYIILCDEYRIRMKIDPTTAKLVGGKPIMDRSRRDQIGGLEKDTPDLIRTGQLEESMRAKTVNEIINESKKIY